VCWLLLIEYAKEGIFFEEAQKILQKHFRMGKNYS
jgi:hypothetical protein